MVEYLYIVKGSVTDIIYLFKMMHLKTIGMCDHYGDWNTETLITCDIYLSSSA